ncbi:hypothetical protein PTKIN_Ptkin12aG0204100 [Pterospermum kingtungense]
MEIGRNMFMGNRGQTGNNSVSLAWDMRELNPATTRFDWGANNLYAATVSTNGGSAARAETSSSSYTPTLPEASNGHELMFLPHQGNATFAHHLNQQRHSLYTGDGSPIHPDPHLVCLKLGKRHYFEDSTALSEPHLPGTVFSTAKKGKPYYSNLGSGGGVGMGPFSSAAVMGAPATVPRCQVEGCHVSLVNAKDYHRRHKVCAIHSKAPKVLVLGLEQRFCQQCSRFHVVSEFDDSKRSCRRRLAGHNERRRKSSHDSASGNSALDNRLIDGRFPNLSSRTGRALSLLSSGADSWISPSDLSSRSSAALRELIAENRAAILAKQLVLDRDWHLHHHSVEDLGDHQAQPGSSFVSIQQHSSLSKPHGWDRVSETSAQVTLDLMQASSSAFGVLSVRKTKEEDEDCSELWNSFEGTHVV